MAKNNGKPKEAKIEKNHEFQKVSETEESQPSQENSSEVSVVIPYQNVDPYPYPELNDVPEPKKPKTEGIIKEIDVNLLKPHPQNVKIYGNEDISDFVTTIKEDGKIKENLVIKAIDEDFVIISGHRRWLAAQKLGYGTVPCEIREYTTLEEELHDILSFNDKREKTNTQRICEGLAWEDVYKKEAAERSRRNLIQNQSEMDNLPMPDEVGLTRDRIAKRVGLSSGKEYDRGKNVMKKIGALKEEGKDKDAELLLAVLNMKISRGEVLAKEVDLTSLSDEDKNNLKIGKANPRAFVSKANERGKSPLRDASLKRQQKKFEDAVRVFAKNLSSSGEGDKENIRTIIKNQIENLQKLLGISNSGESKNSDAQ